MSATDTNAEFNEILDDFWCYLWTMKINAPAPSNKIRDKFFRYVKNVCSDVESWRVDEKTLQIMFSDWINHIGDF